MNWFEIFIGCFLIVVAILPGVEFYPGRAGRERGLKPLDPWIGRLIFVSFGLVAILDGIYGHLRR